MQHFTLTPDHKSVIASAIVNGLSIDENIYKVFAEVELDGVTVCIDINGSEGNSMAYLDITAGYDGEEYEPIEVIEAEATEQVESYVKSIDLDATIDDATRYTGSNMSDFEFNNYKFGIHIF